MGKQGLSFKHQPRIRSHPKYLEDALKGEISDGGF